MTSIRIGRRAAYFVGPFVLSAIVFAAVLIWWGSSPVRAVLFSLIFNATLALLEWQRTRRRQTSAVR